MSDPTALPNFTPSNAPAALRDRVHKTLEQMGAKPELDDDGDIRVNVEEQLLFIRTMDGQLPFMRIFGQWQINDAIEADEVEQLRLANDMTTRLNLVKMSLHTQSSSDGENNRLLLAATDVVVSEDMPLDQVMANCIMGILNSVRTWHTAASGVELDEALKQQQQAAEAAAAAARKQAEGAQAEQQNS